MNDVSKEYSQALFALAVEEEREGEYADSLGELRGILVENPRYIELLASPCVPLSERKSIIDETFRGGDEVTKNLASFLKIIVEKGRIGEILDIIDEAMAMLKSAEGISTAFVTSAVELNDDEKSSLREKLEKKLGHRVELVCGVDESLIGGVVVNVDGNVIDGSIKRKLSDIRTLISD